MVKKTAKCSGCGAAVKMEVCAEEKAEEADAKCRQCEIEAKMEKMMAAQSGLMDRIAELENALVKEREKTQAMGERLRLAEEELAMVVKVNKEAGNREHSAAPTSSAGGQQEQGVKNAGAKSTGHSFQEVVLREGVDNAAAGTQAKHPDSSQVQVTPAGKPQRVIIAGDSNLVRCAEALKERVKGDKRVLVGTFPGHRLGSVMRQAREKLRSGAHGRNLVMIAAGLNDVLNKESSGLATTLAKGVDDMRAISPQVQIVVCTVPEIPVRDGNLQRAVVDANKEIWRTSREKGFEVVEINREVHRWGGFQRDRIHFDRRLGHEVGWRLAGRAVAFLGGTRALRSPG